MTASFWTAEKNKQLQRIYGTAWFTKKELDEYLAKLEELKDAYAPFDPDSETRPLKEASPEERQKNRDRLFFLLRQYIKPPAGSGTQYDGRSHDAHDRMGHQTGEDQRNAKRHHKRPGCRRGN